MDHFDFHDELTILLLARDEAYHQMHVWKENIDGDSDDEYNRFCRSMSVYYFNLFKRITHKISNFERESK